MLKKTSEMISTPFMPFKSIIRTIIPLARQNHLFQIAIPEHDKVVPWRPGQFVEMWVPGAGECPISVCSRYTPAMIELCVRRIGRVTGALFDKMEGDWIGLRGPYGNGFPLSELEGKNLVMVAGGLGVAPIRSLWQYIVDNRERFGRVVLIYGMRDASDLLFRADVKVLVRRGDIDVFAAAECVVGPELPPISFHLGRVTDMLRMADVGSDFHATVCGPPVMYKYVVDELMRKGVPESNMWLLIERHMKCAFGKCGHCFVGGRFTCRDGPVFRLSDLRFIPEAFEDGGYGG